MIDLIDDSNRSVYLKDLKTPVLIRQLRSYALMR